MRQHIVNINIMKDKICGVYKITNTETGDFYIGSSIDIIKRWRYHKQPNVWKNRHNKMYEYMKNVSLMVFKFEILEECSIEVLKEREQYYISTLHPTYNERFAFGQNPEKNTKVVGNQKCLYNGELITLTALYKRFIRLGVSNPREQAKSYLVVRKACQ